jgi:catechol 2,3-dioxygenase-like lactoylglutathione lyase family enzyme
MARGLDHIVHVVRDLEAAGAFYARLGFQVGARNRHPWGTENRLVQLPGFFLEILTVVEPKNRGATSALQQQISERSGRGLSGLRGRGMTPKGACGARRGRLRRDSAAGILAPGKAPGRR